jgi:uncharacterized protein (DUF2141 family)
MEISGTCNTDFVGTNVSPYGCSRDGVGAVPYTTKKTYFSILRIACTNSL